MNADDQYYLERRAKFRCEYCHVPLGQYDVEHVIPRAKHGSDLLSNLAVACRQCNSNKSMHRAFIDPYDDQVAELFSPRDDEWDTHFTRGALGIYGTTSKGRATAALLFHDTRQTLATDPSLLWPISGVDDPFIGRLLINIRAKRLANDFSSVERRVRRELSAAATLSSDVHFALRYALLESYHTRSAGFDDLVRGMTLANYLLAHPVITRGQRYLVIKVKTSLLEQLATWWSIHGRKSLASMFHRKAVGMTARLLTDRNDRLLTLCLRSRQAKNSPTELGTAFEDDLSFGVDMVAGEDYQAIAYLADLETHRTTPSRSRLERLATVMDEVLRTKGYGNPRDLAKLIVVRKRWWLTQVALGIELDDRVFRSDLDRWRSAQMGAIDRELMLNLSELASKKRNRSAHSALRVMSANLARSSSHKP